MPVKKVDSKSFNSEVVIEQRYNIKGGLLKKFMPVEAVVVSAGGLETRYVRLCKSSEWLCQAVAAECPKSRPLARTKLLEDLMRTVVEAQKKNTAVFLMSAETRDEVQVDAAMAGLDADWSEESPQASSAAIEGSQPKKKRREAKGMKDQKVTVLAPTIAQEAATTRDELQAVPQRSVSFWVGENRKALYIEDSAIPWAIDYLHQQFKLCGVSRLDENSSPSKAPNASTGAGSPVRWNSRSQAFTYEVGAVKYCVEPKTLSLQDLHLVGVQKDAESLKVTPYAELRRLAKLIAEHKLSAAGR